MKTNKPRHDTHELGANEAQHDARFLWGISNSQWKKYCKYLQYKSCDFWRICFQEVTIVGAVLMQQERLWILWQACPRQNTRLSSDGNRVLWFQNPRPSKSMLSSNLPAKRSLGSEWLLNLLFGNITFEEGWIAVCSGTSHQFQLESLTWHAFRKIWLSFKTCLQGRSAVTFIDPLFRPRRLDPSRHQGVKCFVKFVNSSMVVPWTPLEWPHSCYLARPGVSRRPSGFWG